MGDYQGDLADIVRASGYTAAEESDRYFPSNPINHFSHPASDFGDPFVCTMRDPLLQNIDTPPSGSFYDSDITKAMFEQAGNTGGFSSSGANFAQKAALDDEMGRSSDIFSRMLQISPNTRLPVSVCESQAATASLKDQLDVPPVLVSNHHTLASPSSSKGRLVESPCLEISSPRNTGIRRRKNQAKKVVCIPAPAPANSRSSGEVVPSDLWAWRKYGQKPIKGSPYPRGYYRCSSSKGCLARKQVERSRNDPNMLVITYTSEHNHPWPTQRNALAGSIRSHASKISSSAAKNSPNSQAQKPTNPNGEQKGISTENTAIYANSADVKEEMSQYQGDNELEKDEFEFDEGSLQSYKPTLSNSNNYSEDSVFSELGEINEADPLDLLFPRGYGGQEYNALDPFSFYDWAANNDDITSAAATSISSTTSWRS